MKKQKAPESLKEILPEIFKRLEKKKFLDEIEKTWEGAVGRRSAPHTKITSLKKEILVVGVDASAWIYELTLKKNEIIKKLKQKEVFKDLKDIRFRIVEF